MSLTYEILKRAVKLAGMKRAGEKSAEEIIEIKTKQNASNQIPELRDPEFDIRRIEVDGFTVLSAGEWSVRRVRVLSERHCALRKKPAWMSLCRIIRYARSIR